VEYFVVRWLLEGYGGRIGGWSVHIFEKTTCCGSAVLVGESYIVNASDNKEA
jgi:hypothetical protein